MENIKQGILNFKLSKNRMEVKKINGITIVNDCYNANFDSMKAALESIGKMQGKRKIAVLGDMLELGKFSKELHEKVGKEVVLNDIDFLITVGTEAKSISKSACESGMNINNVYCFDKNEEVIEKLKSMVKIGDLVLIKASNGMKFIEIVNAMLI